MYADLESGLSSPTERPMPEARHASANDVAMRSVRMGGSANASARKLEARLNRTSLKSSSLRLLGSTCLSSQTSVTVPCMLHCGWASLPVKGQSVRKLQSVP